MGDRLRHNLAWGADKSTSSQPIQPTEMGVIYSISANRKVASNLIVHSLLNWNDIEGSNFIRNDSQYFLFGNPGGEKDKKKKIENFILFLRKNYLKTALVYIDSQVSTLTHV